MKRFVVIASIGFFISVGQLSAQRTNGQPAIASQQQQTITTIILVRHAEKMDDGSKDPPLTEQGHRRAGVYAKMFSLFTPDAIYSSNYHRTISTAKPLADQFGMEIQTYDPGDQSPFLDQLLKDHQGGTVVVVGHSNTLPAAVNYLLKENLTDELPETEYSKIFVVTVMPDGNAKLLPLLLKL